MNFFAHHLWPPAVRIQLTLWYTLVFALLILLSNVILYTQLQTSLVTNLDKVLQLRAQEIAGGINNDNGTITFQDVTGDLPNVDNNAVDQQGNFVDSTVDVSSSALVRILTAKGSSLRASPAFRALIIPAASITQPLHGNDWQGNVATRDGQAVRLYSMALSENGVIIAIVQVGESLAELNTTLRSVVIELLIIAPLILLLGVIGSYWLASRAFAPIVRLTRTTQHIKAGDLHQRVPVPTAHDEVQRLALTLNEMIERLEQSFMHQRRFVANASHELRTPVAVIRSMTDLALLQSSTPQEYATLLHGISAETERLGRLISDLLALARADEGQVILEQELVRLDHLVAAVAANSELLATERGITLQVQAEEPVTILGDEARLIQVIMNLLENAIDYTNAGGNVTLTVTSRDNQACLVIRDTGIGIAPQHIPHIFERFYRADPARVRTDGNSSGLGLAIVDWVVRAHRGSVAVESQFDRGSSFTVTLPLASSHNNPAKP